MRDLSSMDRACGFYPLDAGSIPAGRAKSGVLPPHRKVTAHGRMWTEEDMLAYAAQEVAAAVEQERHDCSIVVWMTMMEAEEPDADDKGAVGWLQEAERRLKERT